MHRNCPLFSFTHLSGIVLAAAVFSVFFDMAQANTAETKHTLSIVANDSVVQTLSNTQYGSWLTTNNTLARDPAYRSEIEKPIFLEKQNPLLASARKPHNTRLIISQGVNDAQLQTFLELVAKKAYTHPEEAKFQLSASGDLSLINEGKTGQEVDIPASIPLIRNAILQQSPLKAITEVRLPMHILPVDTTANTVKALGIHELVGEGTTNFVGSSTDRIFNIRRALEQFHGLVIKPGQEFSFVQHLGEVDGEHGYRPELVIRKNKTEQEFGGGICQVSTTLFRAAVYSGLKITDRRNHSYPVRYYSPIGFDATIYVPRPDLKFVNNTPGNILVQASIEGTRLTFRLYGTSDGRTSVVDGPKITDRLDNGVIKTEFTQTVTDKNGGIFIKDTFKSVYDNPKNYPHPGDILTEKPSDWSKNEWKKYKATNTAPKKPATAASSTN